MSILLTAKAPRTPRSEGDSPHYSMGKHNPLDSTPQDRDVEVDEQAKMALCRFQIRDHLSLMDRSQGLDRLWLNQQLITHHKIHTSLTSPVAPVIHFNRLLAFEGDTTKAESMDKASS